MGSDVPGKIDNVVTNLPLLSVVPETGEKLTVDDGDTTPAVAAESGEPLYETTTVTVQVSPGV
jgi:hypothetical protein